MSRTRSIAFATTWSWACVGSTSTRSSSWPADRKPFSIRSRQKSPPRNFRGAGLVSRATPLPPKIAVAGGKNVARAVHGRDPQSRHEGEMVDEEAELGLVAAPMGWTVKSKTEEDDI